MSKEATTVSPAPVPLVGAASPRAFPRRAWFALAVVGAVFAPSLVAWFRFSIHSDLYSYTLLIPAVTAYMIWSGGKFAATADTPRRLLALAFFLPALLGLAFSLGAPDTADSNAIPLGTAGFVAALLGTAAWFSDSVTFRRLLFPLGFLVFMVPLPTPLLHAVETAMQHGSAAVARVLFELVGTPVYYESLTFQIPGIALHVAPECSGIRSTLVLLVVSVVTGFFFLRSSTHRVLLAVAIVPLALLRNGFRIAVIGELCVRGGPEMIDSFLHRRGGPIFFALSLIPLFLLLIVLQKRERPRRPTPETT